MTAKKGLKARGIIVESERKREGESQIEQGREKDKKRITKFEKVWRGNKVKMK